MQVHLRGISLVGDEAAYEVNCDIYYGLMKINATGGRNRTGQIIFSPPAPQWLERKISEEVWASGSLDKDMGFFIHPPNAD